METARFNYSYDGEAITKSRFESSVPEDWKNDLNEDFEFTYGLYRASLVDDEITVNPRDFEIEDHLGGYYSIQGKLFNQVITVFGGDSADEDCYDRELVENVYDAWDGKLISEQGEFRIDL